MPFDGFPPEIIQRIFSLCCGRVAFIVPPFDDSMRSGTTQVTLSLVCSRWREIALNTSTLWGDVMVRYYPRRKPARGPTASFQFVQDWLIRAGVTPISLYIYVYGALESEIAAISQTLLSSFHITNLELESVECHRFLLPTNNSYYLERLHLTLDAELSVPIDAFPPLPEMPSLKELCLCLDLNFFRDLRDIYAIPWHQLRVLNLCGNTWPSQILFNILQQCKSLVGCNLLVKLQSRQHEHDIVLPNLESLVIEIDSTGSADPIIWSLTLPNLRSLNIRFSNQFETKLSLSPDAIVTMAQRSGFNKHLSFFSLCLMKQPVDVRSLLGTMPALKRVQLHGPLMFQPGTFDDLSSGTIGPQLEEIRFGIISNKEIGLLLETVGQRHEKAKAVPDIRPFASVTCSASGSELKSHQQRAKQCSEAFNADVAILMATSDDGSDWESDQDVGEESDSGPDAA
ncbi:hypothetical protein M378DRAFT_169413 [Amanita muscaria Koide BX008]|uniref:Uncharacterized protein n=1 Tax=Amanita muscaria (strain Koide BX008) TaxID=946122 RepID=A0A0C2WSM2_AMAMK|nr:hypothetical protein M378DRAFT_169413 [Amanita muscaria Koide BX008]